MSKVFSLLAVVQIMIIGYLLANTNDASINYQDQEIVKVEVETPEPVEEIKEEVTKVEEKVIEKDPYDYFIPERRIISGNGIDIDKNINAIATLGEVMLENPLVIRGFERLVRDQFYNFYSDFIKEADLNPEEQLMLFQHMAQAMQDNMKSFMKAIGENMDRMTEFRNGPPIELLQGIRENNLMLKDNLIGSLGEDNFSLFEQYHKEKSAAEEFSRLERRLKSGKMPLQDNQKDELRQAFLDQQVSPFADTPYEQQMDRKPLYETTEGILDSKQQENFRKSRKRHNRIYLLPF